MRFRDDRGVSLAELLVVMLLLGMVLAVSYAAVQFGYRAQGIAETQSLFARTITAPLEVMDSSFAQRVPIYPTLDPYTVTLRMPGQYYPGVTEEHEYSLSTTGTLTQQKWRVTGTTRTKHGKPILWSTTCGNRLTGINKPLFSYYNGSLAATNAALVTNVVIRVYTVTDGNHDGDMTDLEDPTRVGELDGPDVFVGMRRVFFRNN